MVSEKHHVPTCIENFLVSEWSNNISWSSCWWGDHLRRAVLEGGQSILLGGPYGPDLVSHSLPSNGGHACKEWKTTFLSPENCIFPERKITGINLFYPHDFLCPPHRHSLISPQMDQNPLEHRLIAILLVFQLDLSLLSTLCIPKTDTAVGDKTEI